MTQLAVVSIFFVTSILSIFKINNKKDRQTFFLIISVILLGIIIFRNGNELNDYDVYVNMYNHYNEYFVLHSTEPTFIALSWLLNYLSLSVISLFAIYGFIALWFKTELIKKISPYYYLSLVSYISYEFINQELIAIRVGVAIAFVLYSILFIYKGKPLKFILLIVIASLFHYSAFVCMPLYFLRKISNRKRLLFLIISFLFIFIDLTVFVKYIPLASIRNKVYIYLNRDNSSLLSLLFRPTILYRYIILFFFLIFEKKILKYNKYISIEINILLYGLLLNNVF